MKKLLLLTYLILSILVSIKAQVPNSFKYQAVVRDASGALIDNKLIALRISILEEAATGDPVFSEVFRNSTNEYGIIAVNIGTGETVQGIFSNIDWGANSYYLQVEVDLEGGENYQFMGASQILAVPYAMYALNVRNTDDADADPTNEFQTISKNGNLVTLSNSGGSFTDAVDDADADPENEIQDLIIDPVNNILRITNNSNATPISLSAYQGTNTDEQTLDYTFNDYNAPYGLEISIEGGTGGNTIRIPFVNIVDAYQTNYPNYFNSADRTKLNSIETGATADMTNTEIVSAYQSGYTNYFNLTDRAKLNGIEANATADMTNTEIVSAYQSGFPNFFNSQDREKLNGIEIGATADMTNAEIGTAYNAWFPEHFTSSDRLIMDRLSLSNNFTVSGGYTVQLVSQANTIFTMPAVNGTLATESFVTSNTLTRSLNTGRILVGDGGIANELDARGNGFLLVGNGSTLVSSAITGDVSISHNAGITSATVNAIGGNPVTSGMVNNWNTAYSWGNHATEGYLTSATGVSSIAGTTNQIVASGNVGSVTLSLPPAITGLTSVTATTFYGDLSGNAATASNVAASGLTGTALASNVVTSSLSVVGTITSGAWNAGDVTTTGTITGSSFVVPGGSTGFLRANGTVDETVYLTSSSGVSSIAGTTNQIVASGNVGSITLSLPSAITGLTSVTATTFNGNLNGNAATATSVAASGLTGTALASNVVASSLTGVGTITSGTWNADPITGAYLDLSTPGVIGSTTANIASFTTVNISNIIRLTPLSVAPSSPQDGDIYVNSTDNNIYCYINGVWRQLNN